MPQLTVSFFVLAGYFIPGSVLMACTIPVLAQRCAGVCPSCLLRWLDELGAASTVFCGVVALCVTLALGTILSDGYFLLARLVLSGFGRRAIDVNKSTDELLTDTEYREAYVFHHAGEADFHGWAGRIRVLGGSGLAFVLGGLTLLFNELEPTLGVSAVVAGLTALVVGGFRSSIFYRNLDAEAELRRALEKELSQRNPRPDPLACRSSA